LTPMNHGREIKALAILSCGVLLYELLLMRIFSVLMWYHFASLAIGLAMLGLGAGGLAVGLKSPLGEEKKRGSMAAIFAAGSLLVLIFLMGVHAYPALAKATLAPFHQPFYKPFARPETTEVGWLLASRLLLLAIGTGWPFFFAGVATAGALREKAPAIHGAYGATFLGSAFGCIAFPLVLNFISAPAAIGLCAALSSLAAFLFSRRLIWRKISASLLLLSMIFGCIAQFTGLAEIPFARGRYEPGILAVEWNAMSRVAAFPLPPGDTLKPYGLSNTYRGELPRQIGLVVDDSGYTNLYDGLAAAENPEYFRANLVALPYHLRENAKALLFGPGGGKDIWIALSFPNTRVRAVEINPQVVEMVEDRFAPFTGKPYSDSRVSLTINDGRRFALLTDEKYDVISASAVFGRMPPAAGAFTLSEDLLHTLEGFEDYWEKLSERGIISITRFAYEQRALRLTALSRELLDSVGVKDPGAHIRVISDRGLSNVMISKRPFSEEDDEKLSTLVDDYNFSFLYPPPDEAGVNSLTRLVDEAEMDGVLSSLAFDVSPPTDDRPFFYYTVRPGDFLRGHLPGKAGFDDRGAEILRTAFLLLALLSVAALILPAALIKGVPRGAASLGPLAYFGIIALGYMALEIGTMKRLLLLLGHPVYAVSATLFAFLLGSGLGALLSARLAPTRRALAGWLAIAVLLGAAQAYLTPAITERAMLYSAQMRFFVAALVTLPLAFTLGIPFPTGVALLREDAGNLLPWAWAVNGTASVLASLGAVLLAMNFGYAVTISTGALLYLLALLLSFTLEKSRRIVP